MNNILIKPVRKSESLRVQALCESRGGRPGLPVLMSLMVSVDVKQIEPCLRTGHSLSLVCQPTSGDIKLYIIIIERKSVAELGQELCESGGGRPGLPVPNKPYGFCGRKATLYHAHALVTVCP